MAAITQHAPGTFCWPELSTTDQPGAKKFYSALFGWDTEDGPIGDGEFYTMLELKGRSVGALYSQRKDERGMGIPPHWTSYVMVESADRTAAMVKPLGGTLLKEPFDVMDVGRMAVIQDPTGAVFCIWQAKKHGGAGVLNEPGSLRWTELMTHDTASAAKFYSGLFQWKPEVTAGGPMLYTLFQNGQTPAGGMMQITKEMGPIPPHWMVYFAVADCDASVAKAKGLGASVTVPATDVPGPGRFAVLKDPQGAIFAILASSQQS